MSVRKAVKHFAWFWKDRHYRTALHFKARLSRSTLVVLYYRWRRSGKSPACFALHYADRLAPVTPEKVRAFLGACATAGTKSMSQAARLTGGLKSNRPSRVISRLPNVLVQRIKGIFKERRQAELKARAAVKQLQREMRQLLDADRRRVSGLKKLAKLV
jgi:hypothetical protein